MQTNKNILGSSIFKSMNDLEECKQVLRPETVRTTTLEQPLKIKQRGIGNKSSMEIKQNTKKYSKKKKNQEKMKEETTNI